MTRILWDLWRNTCYKLRCGFPANLAAQFRKMKSKEADCNQVKMCQKCAVLELPLINTFQQPHTNVHKHCLDHIFQRTDK